jgi:ABC-2 type transport system permease protein
MQLPPLLRKEALWSRHRILTLLILLVLLPGLFAYATVVFETVVPEDSPVAIVPANESVTQEETEFIQNGASVFSDPTVYEDRADARRALERESVYAIIEVPPGVLNQSTDNMTFTLTVAGSMVPFQEPSRAIQSVLALQLNQALAANVTVERTVVGESRSLSEYLIPLFLMSFLILFAFTYLPYHIAQEADVLERLLVETSLDAVIGTKIAYMTALMLVPIAVFWAVSELLGYSAQFLSPVVVGVFLLTFVYLAAISVAIMVLTEFSTLGRFLNVVLMIGIVTFSGLFYPVGFFSPLRSEIARQIPVHYSMIVTRGLVLKDADPTLYTDWLLALVGVTVLAVGLLKLTIEQYKRTL